MSAQRRFVSWFFEPIDNGALVCFRIVFGFLLYCEAAGAIATGWVRDVLIDPRFTFPHIGFGWLRPLPGDAMYVYFAAMSVCAFLVMVGFHYRAALASFTVLWTAVYLMQTAAYNNHYYLIILLCVLLLLTPAHSDLSIDARRTPRIRSGTCARWCVVIFVAQIAIVYFYAAIAKLYPDWLAGRPIEIWLAARRDYLLGPLYAQSWLKWAMVYGGILFDALIVPMLLCKRTRWLGVALSLVFHLFNSYTFRIGIFPYLGIAFCLFFFPGEQIRSWIDGVTPAANGVATEVVTSRRRLLLSFLLAYFAIQIALPLRHLLYPGAVHWTEEGHRMAWHMMLRTKQGRVIFRVVDRATGEEIAVRPEDHLSPKQAHQIAGEPEMLWRVGRILRAHYAAEGRDVAVYADTQVSLNGRPRQEIVDPEIDLGRVPWLWFSPQPWIVPLRD
jgi:vitamin K-dependent gamma-carboxylase